MAAERSLSLDLLLLLGERSAVPAVAQALQDGCPDEPVQEVEVQVQHQSAAVLSETFAWGAWDGVRRAVAAGAAHPLRAHLADEDAGKSVDRARDVPVQDAPPMAPLLGWLALEQQDAEAPCTPDAVQSEAQSCAVLEPAEQLGQRDAECSERQLLRARMR